MQASTTLLSDDISLAAELLQAGELVAIPTETVYGLAANIFDEQAVQRIFEMKQRPLFNPLIVHIHQVGQLNELCSEIPDKAKALMDRFWPGPLTLVLPKTNAVPDLITANKSTVALRMPQHPLLRSLLQELDFPIAAPSANPFKRISPTNAQRVKDYFEGELPMVLDGGPCEKGIESTIIGFEHDEAILYRLGSLALEEIEQCIGKVKQLTKAEKAPQAPGMLLKHYSPLKPLIFTEYIEQTLQENSAKKIGLLTLEDSPYNDQVEMCISFGGDLEMAANGLYEALQELDQSLVDLIIAQRFPEEGLGKTINDRLERAAH